MQHDEVIWQIIRHNNCSFMTKTETGNFCQNPYNVTGICNRSSCPLANSRYATIRDHKGVFYLYMKSIERSHMPNKLWERVKLPRNYEKALEVIDKHLMYWNKFLVHKTKQRLTKMTQMLIRMRTLVLKNREKNVTTPRKEKKREARREEKAEKAASVEKATANELLKRKTNEDIDIVIPKKRPPLVVESSDEEEEYVIEYVVGDEDLEEEEDVEDLGSGLAAIHGIGANEEADDYGVSLGRLEMDEAKSKLKKKARVLIEVEHEDGGGERQAAMLKHF